MNKESIGERIRRLRKEKNWTQYDLEDKSGVSERSIVNAERDKHCLNLDNFFSVAGALGVSGNFLYYGDDDPNVGLADQAYVEYVNKCKQLGVPVDRAIK